MFLPLISWILDAPSSPRRPFPLPLCLSYLMKLLSAMYTKDVHSQQCRLPPGVCRDNPATCESRCHTRCGYHHDASWPRPCPLNRRRNTYEPHAFDVTKEIMRWYLFFCVTSHKFWRFWLQKNAAQRDASTWGWLWLKGQEHKWRNRLILRKLRECHQPFVDGIQIRKRGTITLR